MMKKKFKMWVAIMLLESLLHNAFSKEQIKKAGRALELKGF
jgi:hypothetical protein